MKRIGLLTSGGDASGMNAAIRAVTRTAASMGIATIGFQHGYDGLVTNTWDRAQCPRSFRHSGTGRNHVEKRPQRPVSYARGTQAGRAGRPAEPARWHGHHWWQRFTDGGYLLGQLGIPVAGVASTIDNDLYGFDYTIGFDTAVNVAIDAIDRIRDAAESHDRVFVVEVMGRDNGSIALEAAIATGADIVLTPELPFSIPELITHLRDDVMAQKKHHIIVMAEGAGHAEELARYINANLPVECRATVLGYVQRGGSPTRFDRILASTSGEAAVVALTEGCSSVVAGTRNGHIVLQDTLEAVTRRNLLKPELVELLRRVSI